MRATRSSATTATAKEHAPAPAPASAVVKSKKAPAAAKKTKKKQPPQEDDVVVQDDEVQKVVQEDNDADADIDEMKLLLAKKTVKQLIQILLGLGLDGGKGCKKAELVERVFTAQKLGVVVEKEDEPVHPENPVVAVPNEAEGEIPALAPAAETAVVPVAVAGALAADVDESPKEKECALCFQISAPTAKAVVKYLQVFLTKEGGEGEEEEENFIPLTLAIPKDVKEANSAICNSCFDLNKAAFSSAVPAATSSVVVMEEVKVKESVVETFTSVSSSVPPSLQPQGKLLESTLSPFLSHSTPLRLNGGEGLLAKFGEEAVHPFSFSPIVMEGGGGPDDFSPLINHSQVVGVGEGDVPPPPLQTMTPIVSKLFNSILEEAQENCSPLPTSGGGIVNDNNNKNIDTASSSSSSSSEMKKRPYPKAMDPSEVNGSIRNSPVRPALFKGKFPPTFVGGGSGIGSRTAPSSPSGGGGGKRKLSNLLASQVLTPQAIKKYKTESEMAISVTKRVEAILKECTPGSPQEYKRTHVADTSLSRM